MASTDLSELRRNLAQAGFDPATMEAMSGIAAPAGKRRRAEADSVDRETLLQAALSGAFLPRDLEAGLDSGPAGAADALLALCETVVTPSGRAWRLRSDVRRDVLVSAAATGELNEILAKPAPVTDDLQRTMLRRLLGPAEVNLESLSLEQLESLGAILHLLSGTSLAARFPSALAVQRAQARRELLDPFLTLVGRTGPGRDDEGKDRFVGREAEMERLRAYIGVLPPDRWVDSLRRGVTVLWSGLGAGSEPSEPLRIKGLGGAGKSTLIAKFVLEHSQFMLADPARGDLRLPFVYLDFDRATLSAREPLQLLLDMSMQIPIWLLETEPAFATFRDNLRSAIDERGRSTSMARERETWSELKGHCRQFMDIVEAANAGSAPVVLFFDTFEMVQYDPLAVAGVQGLIGSLRNPAGQSWKNLRVIVSGRGDLREVGTKLRPLNIGPLSLRATRELIGIRNRQESLGLSVEEVKALAKPLTASPLDVVIVTAWMKDNPDQAQSFVEEIAKDAELQSEADAPASKGSEARVTALLVRRMIAHIKSRSVRDLAVPGFVVRAITPEVIREVMMPRRDLDPAAAAEFANVLFRRLKAERWLVYPRGNLLRHRPEVRRAMLRLIRQRDRTDFYDTNERALGFFMERSEGRLERAEAMYHLLLAEQPRLVEAEALWRSDVAALLATAVDDLDGIARDYLKIRLGHGYSEDMLASMPAEVLDAVIASSGSAVLDRIGPDSAFSLVKRRPEIAQTPAGIAFVEEATYRSGRWGELVGPASAPEAKDRILQQLDELAARRPHAPERRDLRNLLQLSLRDRALDGVWEPVLPRFLGRLSAAEDVLQWDALALAAAWQRRNPQKKIQQHESFPDAVEVATRLCRNARTLSPVIRSSTGLRILALLESRDSSVIVRNVDLRSHFATVGSREFGLFTELLEAAAQARASVDDPSGDYGRALDEGRSLVGSVQSRENRIILDPRLSSEMAAISERLISKRPEALGHLIRRILFVSHPDWLEPLGSALERAYSGDIPTRLGWFTTIDALLGEEAGGGRRRGSGSGGRQILALADEAGHLLDAVRAYREHLASRDSDGASRDFEYLAARLEAWVQLLEPNGEKMSWQAERSGQAARSDGVHKAAQDDPQKHQWGQRSERNGWRLQATVKGSKGDPDWFRLDLRVIPTEGGKLTGPVVFHLHNSFADPVREVEPRSSAEAALRLWAYGAFTVGALITQDGTTLELDLADLPDAPKAFKSQ
jgi:hypothetical protein